MAHFAKLNENNIVIDVIVINNLELDPLNEEASGLAWLETWSGGYTNWKQTSYNGSFRKNYAGIGYKYDENLDAFIPIKIFDSWILNEDTCQWEAPIPRPSDEKLYVWNEADIKWDEIPDNV